MDLSRRHLIGAAAAVALAGTARGASVETLTAAGGRQVAVTRWRGAGRGTILFSHGAASAPWKYAALLDPWAAAGYEILAPLHVDSTDHPDTARFTGFASWRARLEDMAALAAGTKGRLIAAGHSYGGLVALTLGGAAAVRPADYAGPMRDARVRAVVAFSPPGPTPGLVDAAGYATLAVPALVETGTLDVPPGGAPDGWRTHLSAFDTAAPGGDRFGVVLDGADHYFGNIICRPERAVAPQAAAFAAASRIAGLFLDAYGGDDRTARDALLARLGTHDGATVTRR